MWFLAPGEDAGDDAADVLETKLRRFAATLATVRRYGSVNGATAATVWGGL